MLHCVAGYWTPKNREYLYTLQIMLRKCPPRSHVGIGEAGDVLVPVTAGVVYSLVNSYRKPKYCRKYCKKDAVLRHTCFLLERSEKVEVVLGC